MNAVVTDPSAELQTWLQQALAYQRAGQPVEASQYYLFAIRAKPDYWPAYYNLGINFQELGEHTKAHDAYRRVTQLNPSFAEAHNNLGSTLKALKRDADAEAAYRQALTLKPSLAEAAYNIALIQQANGQFSDAIVSLEQVVASNPAKDDAWDALYRAQLALTRQEAVIATFLAWEAAIGQSPLLTAAGLAQSRFLGDRAREEKYVALAVTWPFANPQPGEIQPVLGMLQYYDVAPEALLTCYQRYNEAVAAGRPKRVAMLPVRSAGKKIRVGYVSADFRRHVMGRIMADVIGAHDRAHFDITLISLCEKRYHDDVTEAFRATSNLFLDVASLSDIEAATIIAEADLDILVDLAGHTMGARPTIYAHRPARVIATHLGYHGAIGLSAIDFKITDRIADPSDMAAYQLETPLYLEGCLFPFVHMAANAEAYAYHRAQKPTAHFVFGVFVNVMKLSARCLETWRQILERIPHAVLAFSPINTDDIPSIERVLRVAGIPSERMRVIPAGGSEREKRARYAAIDAVLDTFPYAGGDTTLAALDCDIPVVTLCGKRNAERVGASLLHHMGTPQLIANTETEYIDIACKLVNDPTFGEAARTAIAHARVNAPIGNPATHVRALERAYREVVGEIKQSATLSAKDFFAEFRAAMAARPPSDVRLAALMPDQSDYVPLLQARAQLAHQAGDDALALRFLTRVAELAPHETESLLALAGIVLGGSAQAAQAEIVASLAHFDGAPETRITARVAKMRARLLNALGRFVDALAAITQATSSAPNDVDAQFIHANTLANLDRAGDALALYQRVLMLDPRHSAACLNAAQLLADRGDWHSAESLLRRAIEISPDDETAYAKLAPVLKRARKWPAFVGLGKVMQARFPHSLGTKLIRAEAYRYDGNLPAEGRQLAKLAEALCAVEAEHAVVEDIAHAVMQRLSALDFSPALTERLTSRYLQAVNALYGGRVAQPIHESRARLRIGALVSDLDNAAHADAIFRVLSMFNRGDQEWRLYALNATPVAEFDAWLTKISPDAQGFLLAGMSIDSARARLESDTLDVLIDLTGHRHFAAIPILLQRAARLTLSNGALALHTFGLRAYLPDILDFELFDRATALPSWQSRGAERAMMAVPTLLPPSVGVTAVAAPRPFPQDAFVFALTASVTNISEATFQLARAIIASVPHVLLAVEAENEATLQVWQRLGQQVGISANRFVARASAGEAPSRFAHVDGLLDARPGSDALAVSDALATGTPVITMRGPTAMERMGYAVLAAAGLDELVADSGPDYVNLATRLVMDTAWRLSILAKIAHANANRQPAVPGSGVDAIVLALKNLPERAESS